MGLENFCDRSLTPSTCAALAGLSIPDILQFLNNQTGLRCVVRRQSRAYYAGLLDGVISDLRYRSVHGLGLPAGLQSYPGFPAGGSPQQVLDVAKQLQQLLLRYSEGTSAGIAGDPARLAGSHQILHRRPA